MKTWFSPFRRLMRLRFRMFRLKYRFENSLTSFFTVFIGAFLRTIVMIIGVFFIAFKAL